MVTAETLRAAINEFLDAEAAVEAEARRAEANGGKGWSSGPVVRRLHAIKLMAEAVGRPSFAVSTYEQSEKPRTNQQQMPRSGT